MRQRQTYVSGEILPGLVSGSSAAPGCEVGQYHVALFGERLN
jgi:hypothetical protein